MLLNLFTIAIGILNPRIVHFIMKHGRHLSEDQTIKRNIDQGFAGRWFAQLTCEGCGRQKEFRLHGFKPVTDFIDDLHRDPRKK